MIIDEKNKYKSDKYENDNEKDNEKNKKKMKIMKIKKIKIIIKTMRINS